MSRRLLRSSSQEFNNPGKETRSHSVRGHDGTEEQETRESERFMELKTIESHSIDKKRSQGPRCHELNQTAVLQVRTRSSR